MVSAQYQFDALVYPLLPALRIRAKWKCGNADDAEDRIQEMLYKAWRSWGTRRGSLKSWLQAILDRCIIDHYRYLNTSVYPPSVTYTDLGVFIGEDTETEDDLIHGAVETIEDVVLRRVQIERWLSYLNKLEYGCFQLVYVQGMHYTEAAIVLGISAKMVKMNIVRGQKRIHELIAQESLSECP